MSLKKQTSSEELLDLTSYRDQDAQQFEALNEKIQSKQSHSSHRQSRQEKPVHHRFTYSESDAAQFQKILPDADSADKQEIPITDKKIYNGFGSAYKQSDNAQFQALMNFNDNKPLDHDAKSALTNNDDRSFSYSELDLQTFNQLTVGNPDKKASTSDISSRTPTRQERDVGPIKIMEFDGKKSKARKRTRQGNVNIKVRYFD